MLEFKEFGSGEGIGAFYEEGENVSVPKETPPHVLRDLGAFFEEKVESLPHEMVSLAEEYGEEKRSIKAAENKIKARKRVLLEKEEKLFAMFEAIGMTTFGTGEYTYYTRVDSYPSIDANKVKAAHTWIKEEGFGDIIKLTVNLKSLGSVLKEVFEVTGVVPGEEDGIKIRTVNRVGVRKR